MLKVSKYILLLFLGVLILPVLLFASNQEKPLNFFNVRTAAMGGAYVAIADDNYALVSNPAGLIQQKTSRWKLLEFQMGIGEEILDRLDEIQEIANDLEGEEQTEALGDLVPLKSNFKLSGSFLNYTGPSLSFLDFLGSNFGVGGFAQSSMKGDLLRPTLPTVVAEGYADIAFVLGFAKPLDLDWVPAENAFGYSLKYINRTYTPEFRQSATSIINDEIDPPEYSNASGFAIDLGLLSNTDIPYIGNAKLGFVVQNIGGTLSGKSYDVSGNVIDSSYQETLPITSKIGIAWNPNLDVDWPVVSLLNGKLTVAADYDLFIPEITFWERVHMGAEKRLFNDIFAIRFGSNQGYITWGAGVDFFMFHMNYAYYLEEIGSKVGDDPATYHIMDMSFTI